MSLLHICVYIWIQGKTVTFEIRGPENGSETRKVELDRTFPATENAVLYGVKASHEGERGGCPHAMHGRSRVNHRPSHPYKAGTEHVGFSRGGGEGRAGGGGDRADTMYSRWRRWYASISPGTAL